MPRNTADRQFRVTTLRSLLALLMVYGLLHTCALGAQAAVHLLYFTAAPRTANSIRLAWGTGSEDGTVAFNLYRSLDPGAEGKPIGDPVVHKGDPVTGADYYYDDTNVAPGIHYYYTLKEITETGDLVKIATADISMPTFTPTATATATAIVSVGATVTRTPTSTATVPVGATVTRTPTRTTTPPVQSDGPPTATRQFTNTPGPTSIPTASSFAATPFPPAPATSDAIVPGVVSTPTEGSPPQPTSALVEVVATLLPTSLPLAAPTEPTVSPSPEIIPTDAVRPAMELTLTATGQPRVFAAATVQPASGTPARGATRPTPAPVGEESRNTGTILMLGGGAIVLAAALGGGVLLLMRSRRQ
jgi:hypothetical protein